MTTSVIFARNHGNIIGVDQKLPWDFEEDMTWFKDHTSNQVLIMGRKTFDSMGSKGLPHRENIVVSRNLVMDDQLFTDRVDGVAASLEEALANAKPYQRKIFVIGGAGLIKEAIPLVDRIVMTTVGKTLVESKYREVTKLDVKGLEGYFNEYMNVDGLPFKMVEASIRSLPDRSTGYTEFVHFTVHERVR